jgi:signal transduction histidine kinase
MSARRKTRKPDEPPTTTEELLARLSVLQELTVSALDLFDADQAAGPFLERVADRLGCLAALWVAMPPGIPPTLVGAAGLSEASRAMPIVTPASTDPAALLLPFPEVGRPGLTRWQFQLQESTGEITNPSQVLLLWFDAQLEPTAEYRAAIERLVGVLRTVSRHRQLTEDLRRSYSDLAAAQLALVERERLAAVGELAAVIAHEVRNPLAVMFNCIGTLEKPTVDPDESVELLAILGEEASRLNHLVSELLDFARPRKALLETRSLEDIVLGAVTSVRAAEPLLQSGAIKLEIDVVRPLPPLMLDARLIRRALVNLLCNAVEAMPHGGHIVVRVTQETFDDRPAARIEIIDDGPGISRELQARVFEPFFTTKAAGTGLGLSIVKRVVEAHHGDLAVHSEGRGTCFIVRLPSVSGNEGSLRPGPPR